MSNTTQLGMAAVQEEPWPHQTRQQHPQVTVPAGWPQVGTCLVNLPHIEFNIRTTTNSQPLRAAVQWEATVMILWEALSCSLSGSNVGCVILLSFLNFDTLEMLDLLRTTSSLLGGNQRINLTGITELKLRLYWHDLLISFLDQGGLYFCLRIGSEDFSAHCCNVFLIQTCQRCNSTKIRFIYKYCILLDETRVVVSFVIHNTQCYCLLTMRSNKV